jgi:class 3 adenylate cyclase
MAAKMDNVPEPVVLIMADISGYTAYMTANAKALAHGQALITELITTILREVELPLKVAKLEGDAVFLFARKEDSPAWSESKRVIGRKLVSLFSRFAEKVSELGSATTCTCSACAHVQALKLKVIVHSGEALFHQLLQFEELAGVDVIIVHRLLKNSVSASEYLLLTSQAQNDIELPESIRLEKHREDCEGIGRIDAGIYFPEEQLRMAAAPQSSLSGRMRASVRLFLKLWFKPLISRNSDRRFTHLTAKNSRASGVLFSFITLVLTPIFVPVGAAFAIAHALKQRRCIAWTQTPDHKHKADRSCCAVQVEKD